MNVRETVIRMNSGTSPIALTVYAVTRGFTYTGQCSAGDGVWRDIAAAPPERLPPLEE